MACFGQINPLPDVGGYYPKGSYTGIDIYNIERSIKIIEETMQNNTYEKKSAQLADAKNLVMEKYNFFYQIIELCESKLDLEAEKKTITISKRTRIPYPVDALVRKYLCHTQQQNNFKEFINKNVTL